MGNNKNFINGIINELLDIYDKLVLYNQEYYDINNIETTVDDDEYDELEESFLSMYNRLKDNTEFNGLPNYQKITELYNNIISGKNKIIDTENISVMVSIEKIASSNNKNATECVANIRNIYKRLLSIQNINESHKNDIILSPKYDGIAIKLIIVNQNIHKILTKGGQDITDLLINHKDVSINRFLDNNGKIKYSIIHGELVVSKEIFNQKYSDEYKNPRNSVVGILKQNPSDLTFIPCTDGVNTIIDKKLNPYVIVNPTDEYLKNLYGLYQNQFKSDNFPYQVDGIVFSSIVNEQYIPENSQYPNNLVALKFPSEIKITKVLGINWTIKKSGKLTPVLTIIPTEIDGSTISEVSCYSYNMLTKFKCGVGSTIVITKGNDIIPKVVVCVTQSKEYNLPHNTKIIGKHLFIDENITENKEKLNESINFKFVNALKSLNIDGIGNTIASNLGDKVFNNDILEVFNVENKMKLVEYLKNDSAIYRKFSEIYKLKKISLDKLIYMLQFTDCGVVLSRRCAEIITKINTDTTGLNKSVVMSVCSGDGFKRIQESIAKLRLYGVQVIKPIMISDDTINYEMTGNPPKSLCSNKSEFVKLMENKYPNSNHTTLTKNTTILFTDDLNSNSSKMNKARKYNVKIKLYQEYDK